MREILGKIYSSILRGKIERTYNQVIRAIDLGISPETILNQCLISAMSEVGRQFENNQIYVPEMLISSRAMKKGMEVLRPLLIEEEVKPIGKVVIGTVKGDLHDIGKNLVGMMLEGAGFDVNDLGTNVSTETFVEIIKLEKPDILGMSALLTTTMPQMSYTIKAIQEAGLRHTIRIIVGGAPITPEYAKEISADGFARDASQAAALAKRLVAI